MTHTEYLFEYGYIDPSDITLTEQNKEEGLSIAKKLGVTFKGFWAELGKYLFNDDDVTESSFAAKDYEEAKHKLKQLRLKFGMA